MYTQKKSIDSSRAELSNFIEEQDIYNSKLLAEINQPGIVKILYTVTSDLRPDLVAKDFYGSTEYLGLLLVQVSPTLGAFKYGSVLRLIPKATLDQIITTL